jgi:glycosyltransferase involved in cell wall biosynthesis
MPDPLISVIVPAYNAAPFLAEAVESVFAQDYEPLEAIIVDDGSTDTTSEQLDRFSGRVRILHQGNRGPSAARNAGLAVANGPLVAFLDADDVWLPAKLRVQADRMVEEPSLAFTVTRFRYFLHPGCAIPPAFRREHLDRDLDGWIPSALVVRREAFDRIGGFDESLRVSEDVDWFARAREAGLGAESIPRVLLRKRVHDRNASLTAQSNEKLFEAVRRSLARRRAARK